MAETLRKDCFRPTYPHTKFLRIVTTFSLVYLGDQVFLSKNPFSLALKLFLNMILFPALFLIAALTLVLVGCYLQA